MVEMKDFVLYTDGKSSSLDPVHLIVRLYRVFCDVKDLREVRSGYWWNGAGDLPVLRFNDCVFHKERIIDFLKLTYDLDFDLSLHDRALSDLLQELCVSALHPATVVAIAAFRSDSLWDSVTWPLLFFERIKRRLFRKWFLQEQHFLVSADEALRKVKETHAALSKMLGLKPFFFTGTSPRPRSADLVVYAYLKEETANLLPTHPHLQDLRQYPNLVVFMEKMETLATSLVPRIQDFAATEWFIVKPFVEQQPFLLLYDRKDRDYSALRALGSGAEPPAKQDADEGRARRGYVTGTCGILFLYLFFKHPSS